MKLNEVLSQEKTEALQAADEWFKNFKVQVDSGNWIRKTSYKTKLLKWDETTKQVELQPIKSSLLLYWNREAGSTLKNFEWPIKFPLKMHNISLQLGDMYEPRLKINGFQNLPEAQHVTIMFADFDSLAGVEKSTAKSLHLSFVKLNCGVLRLLKMPNLESFSLSMPGGSGKDVQLEEIIEKHLKDKDLVACQNDLIDAGLEKYAKL